MIKKFGEYNSNDFIIKNIMTILEDDERFGVELETDEDESWRIQGDHIDWDYRIAMQRVPGQKTIKNSEAISIIEDIVQRLENEGLTAQVLLNGRHGIEEWRENYSSSEYSFVLHWISLLIWD